MTARFDDNQVAGIWHGEVIIDHATPPAAPTTELTVEEAIVIAKALQDLEFEPRVSALDILGVHVNYAMIVYRHGEARDVDRETLMGKLRLFTEEEARALIGSVMKFWQNVPHRDFVTGLRESGVI